MECTIYLTDDCNMKCNYCYEGNEKNKSVLSEDKLKTVLQYIIDNNPVNDPIDLVFLGGEPLLNPKMMVKAIEIINSKYADCKDLFHYSITTNGTLLTRDIIDFLIENSFQISISVDGDEETHNLNRKSKNGKSVFPIVMKNIKYLIEKDVDFSVRMTVTKNNVHKFYNNVKFFDDLGVKKIFAAYDEFADWDDKSIYILEEQMNLLDAFYLESIIQDKDKILNLYDYKLTTFIAERTPMFCSAGSKGHITINSRGEIYPCGFVSSDKNWKIGDVKSGLDTAKFKNEIKKHLYDKAKCKGYDIAFTCSGTKCGFKNFATTGYLNYPSEQICKLEHILYKHNYKVIKELCKQNHPRFTNFYDFAQTSNIEISSILKKMLEELRREESCIH